MKTPLIKIAFLPMILLLFSTMTKAQYSEEDIAKKGYVTDGIINILIDYIPSGWKFAEGNGCFIFQRNDSIWEVTENTLNVPLEEKEAKKKRIQADGKKTVSRIVIKYEDKWDFLRIQEATLLNQKTYNEMRLLPEKHNIVSLKDPSLSSKGSIIYTPKTNADKKKVSDYNNERKKLEEKLINIPELSSQKYSLFIMTKQGCNDDTHIVYPDEASVELYGILSFLREICGK